MARSFRILGMVAVICITAMPAVRAQAILEPPFGLRWADSPQKLMDWADKHSLDVNLFLPGDQPSMRVLKIQPRKGFLPESQAAGIEGRFIAGKLYEVTVHYVDPEASAQVMEGRFEELRRQITTEQGALTANLQQKSVADQFVTKTQSFHREPVKGLFILLAVTEAEDQLRNKRELRFSLIYRNDNLKAEVQQTLSTPGQ